jgi:hypothetical protein
MADGLVVPSNPARVSLNLQEVTDLLEAIDSHVYWQIADQDERNNGGVDDDDVEDEEDQEELKRFRALEQRLEVWKRVMTPAPPKPDVKANQDQRRRKFHVFD